MSNEVLVALAVQNPNEETVSGTVCREVLVLIGQMAVTDELVRRRDAAAAIAAASPAPEVPETVEPWELSYSDLGHL